MSLNSTIYQMITPICYPDAGGILAHNESNFAAKLLLTHFEVPSLLLICQLTK